jgi:flagellar protein FlaG
MSIESIAASIGMQRPATHNESSSRNAEASQRVAARKAESSPPAEIKQNASSNQQSNDKLPALEEAVKQLSDFASKNRPELSFSVDEASGVHVVRIVDTTTKEVIRQFPSEEAIQLAQALDKLQGLFVKDKA